jgi:hypothetical protein
VPDQPQPAALQASLGGGPIQKQEPETEAPEPEKAFSASGKKAGSPEPMSQPAFTGDLTDPQMST